MMTQPITIFKDLTSETAPAGGNVAKTGFSLEDRPRLEMDARYARSQMIANLLSDAIVWTVGQYRQATAGLRASLHLRAAEAQLYRMGDRELADLGLCRADIPFAVREAASEGVSPEFEIHTAPVEAANRNTSPAIFWAGRA
jgi:uncharacterized protein YjiS (DUF1127 family)